MILAIMGAFLLEVYLMSIRQTSLAKLRVEVPNNLYESAIGWCETRSTGPWCLNDDLVPFRGVLTFYLSNVKDSAAMRRAF